MRNLKQIKELKDLTLLDRFLFAEAIEDPETMEIILEIILGKEILLKHLPQSEKEQRAFKWSRQVRLDVWAQDIDDNIYDTEVQKRDTEDLPKRSRLYNSMIDSKLLEPGSIDFNKLNDVFIIIIAPFDLFGKGLYKYTFKMKCEESSDIDLNDGATRIFLNTRGTDKTGVSDELVELLTYFEKTSISSEDCMSEKVLKLHNKIDKIKSSEDMGVKYMNLWEEKLLDRQDGYEEGLAVGKSEGVRNTAVKMKENNFEYEVIQEITGLSIEEIEAL